MLAAADILIVDDTRANLKLLTNILVEQGYQVRPASSGRLALRAVAAKAPDLILLDVLMPEMDGYTVCQRLKADPETRPIPVIFISALNEAPDKVQGFAAGAVDYITKPCQPAEVLARVHTHLELRRLQRCLEQEVEARTTDLAWANRALQASEQGLREHGEFLNTLLEAIPVPVFYKDAEGRYLGCNQAFADFHGKTHQELIGKTVFNIAPQELAASYHAKDLEILRHGGQQVYESEIQDTSGAVRDVIFHKAAFTNADGRFGGIIGVILDITQRKRAEEQIAYLAYHDPLTQLPNRVLLADRLRQAMAQSRRNQKRLAVCYLDLDDFKPINDRWGHHQGDQILVEVARRLKSGVRASDTVARLGGDEFVLLLGNLADAEECKHALDRVFTILEAPFEVAGQPLSLTASVGVTLSSGDESDPDALLRCTDQAMYAAKQAGGRRYRWFDADHDRRARAHRELLQRVEAGLAAEEFRLHYQPKVDIRAGAVIGAEALIRWQHPDEGLLPPARFMPAVETDDLVVAVDRWVMGEALRQMSVWADQGLHLPVSVNISGRHLQRRDFVAGLQAVLAAHPTVPPGWLELEILETAALDDVAAISRLIEECRRLGLRFALDDFGTGYSSLTYLKHLPVQVLKIDQSFVRDLLVDADARAIVEGVIGLAAAFRREVIAEGVETDAHGRQLMHLGCTLVQGYGIARPMPPERIPDWVANWTSPGAWIEGADPRRNE